MENQSGKIVKALRSDNGGEYISKEFVDFCVGKGIKTTTPYTPAQNGVAMYELHDLGKVNVYVVRVWFTAVVLD